MDIASAAASASRRLPNLRGKMSLGWALMRHLDRRGTLQGTWDLSLPDGRRYVLPRQAPMAWAAAFLGSYDLEHQALLTQFVEPDTLVLDVGASIGLWTVPLARSAEMKRAQVWAFEPHPGNHPWLHRNIAINDLGGTVKVHEVALGDTVGEVVVHADAGDPRAGGNAAVALGDEPGGVTTPITTLDAVPRSARVSAVKLDVEGYEIRVLRGAAALLREDKPVIFGEFNRTWLKDRGEDLPAFLDEMRDSGYDVFAVEHLRSRPWRPHDTTRLRRLDRHEVSEDLLLKPRP